MSLSNKKSHATLGTTASILRNFETTVKPGHKELNGTDTLRLL